MASCERTILILTLHTEHLSKYQILMIVFTHSHLQATEVGHGIQTTTITANKIQMTFPERLERPERGSAVTAPFSAEVRTGHGQLQQEPQRQNVPLRRRLRRTGGGSCFSRGQGRGREKWERGQFHAFTWCGPCCYLTVSQSYVSKLH